MLCKCSGNVLIGYTVHTPSMRKTKIQNTLLISVVYIYQLFKSTRFNELQLRGLIEFCIAMLQSLVKLKFISLTKFLMLLERDKRKIKRFTISLLNWNMITLVIQLKMVLTNHKQKCLKFLLFFKTNTRKKVQ